MKFIVTFTPDEDGGFVAACPALPGCISHGDTLDEAEQNIREAIDLSLEARRANNLPLYVEIREIEIAA